ncbi:MAG: carboxypeptidase regulatory-like domain-containing protein, partial [Acidobacteria bacterium]|nr:carboxypeptidase regulatory-like domain-containing protein [Acidobacteriota bacterium]
MSKSVRSIAILLLLALGAASLCAQGERGTLNGTVTDPTGAVIPGASVKGLNVATGVETAVQTTSAGVFRMPYLPPGTYRLTASAAGFKTAVRDNVILAVAQTLTVDFALEVGAVTDQVTVSAEPPLLETGTAEIGSYVTKKEFDTWPIAVGDGRRQIQQFIFSSLPGTVGSTWQGSINGGQEFSHEILIDGIALGRMDIQGGSNNEFSPSAESV